MSDGMVMRPGVRADIPTDEPTEHVLLNDSVAQAEPVAVLHEGRLNTWRVTVFPPGDAHVPLVAVASAVDVSGVAFQAVELDDIVTVTGLLTFDDAVNVANRIRRALRGGGV